MNENIRLLLPPYLQTLGYIDVPNIQKLSDKCFKEDNWHPYWVEWRGIFDYLACVEYSFNSIRSLPKGSLLMGNFSDVHAKYHSASLVFFSQATLDNVAVWLKNKYSLNARGANISLSKSSFQNELINKDSQFEILFSNHSAYLDKLNTYRMDWVHRIIGGAVIGGDKRPDDPDFTDDNIQVLIPMDSSLNLNTTNFNELHKKIEEIKKDNNGNYMYSVDDFADYILGGTKNLIFDTIEIVLPLFD